MSEDRRTKVCARRLVVHGTDEIKFAESSLGLLVHLDSSESFISGLCMNVFSNRLHSSLLGGLTTGNPHLPLMPGKYDQEKRVTRRMDRRPLRSSASFAVQTRVVDSSEMPRANERTPSTSFSLPAVRERERERCRMCLDNSWTKCRAPRATTTRAVVKSGYFYADYSHYGGKQRVKFGPFTDHSISTVAPGTRWVHPEAEMEHRRRI